MNRHRQDNYFSEVINDTDAVLRRVEQCIADSGAKFDTLVVTGMSGAVAGALIAPLLGVNLWVVRKEDDRGTHDWNRQFGAMGNRWVFFDDFVATGATIERVMNAVEGYEFPHDPEYVGTLCYSESAALGWSKVAVFTPVD